MKRAIVKFANSVIENKRNGIFCRYTIASFANNKTMCKACIITRDRITFFVRKICQTDTSGGWGLKSEDFGSLRRSCQRKTVQSRAQLHCRSVQLNFNNLENHITRAHARLRDTNEAVMVFPGKNRGRIVCDLKFCQPARASRCS